jgi:putative RNA 2'-phosphotransferase
VSNNSGKFNISKFLSLVLRHKPSAIGIELDAAGWVNITELVEKVCKSGLKLTAERIRQVVAVSDKQRFTISEDGLQIRANQGHSIPVDLGLEEAEPPLLLYHGTSSHNLASIRQQGLIKGKRQYVHLSRDKETATMVGKRYGKPVVLSIKTGCMYQDGFKFYLSANGVWLTDHVPTKYINCHKII